MSNPFLGEIRICSFPFAPKGWALCNGQFLPINQNQALFALLGTQYGGNGQTTFQLPDFRGRVPLHWGAGYVVGQRGGQEAHTLSVAELPAHVHFPQGDPSSPTQTSPSGHLWAAQSANGYTTAVTNPVGLSPLSITQTGGSQPHANLAPYTVLNFVIALQGIFPSRN
jgi:microcystin-dependent protein